MHASAFTVPTCVPLWLTQPYVDIFDSAPHGISPPFHRHHHKHSTLATPTTLLQQTMHMPVLRLGGFFFAAALFGACTLPDAEANKTRKFWWKAVAVGLLLI